MLSTSSRAMAKCLGMLSGSVVCAPTDKQNAQRPVSRIRRRICTSNGNHGVVGSERTKVELLKECILGCRCPSDAFDRDAFGLSSTYVSLMRSWSQVRLQLCTPTSNSSRLPRTHGDGGPAVMACSHTTEVQGCLLTFGKNIFQLIIQHKSYSRTLASNTQFEAL